MTKTAFVLLAAILFISTPAFAQFDLGGNWAARLHEDWEEHGPGPEAVDFLGLPLNDEGRARALSYSQSALSLPERQCFYYPPYYVVTGPQPLRIWADTDPTLGRVVAWNISAAPDRGIVKIWMDGRPHPSEDALHTFTGFTTGVWEGNTLTTTTTHFKEGYLRRNGAPTSDKATLTMHFSRHGDTLTATAIIDDPVYLSRSHIVNRSWQLDPTADFSPVTDPCVPAEEVDSLKAEGAVPHYLPGENPFVNEMTRMYNIPVEAVMGGAETMYPEYRKKLKDHYVAPTVCTRYCCGWAGAPGSTAPGLQCLTAGSGKLAPATSHVPRVDVVRDRTGLCLSEIGKGCVRVRLNWHK